ncbi:MAG TPA: phosphoesterase [Pirellulales bacterium]|nr:phosphoesterase [Pirellulales bacterium]
MATQSKIKLQKNKSDSSVEQILVVPTQVFHRLGHFQGFCGDAERYLNELLKPEHVSFRPRPEMEQDPSYKQLIPYCLLRHVSADGVESLFTYTRGTGQGEGRLHRKRSVGIGGHLSAEDAADADGDPYGAGMRRELAEEVVIDTPFRERCVGLINDDETEVGRVHLGVVHIFDVGRPAVRPREDEIIDCGFRPVEELLADLTGFETWSTICLQALFGSYTARGRL